MQKQESGKTISRFEAVVHQVDSVTRELTAGTGTPVTIYVPPDCEVTLRGERVKLRMVQRGDRILVTHTASGKQTGCLVARKIDVQPDHRLPTLLN